MAKKLTVAVAGLVHDHVWGLVPQFVKCRDTEVVGASDPNKALIDKFAE